MYIFVTDCSLNSLKLCGKIAITTKLHHKLQDKIDRSIVRTQQSAVHGTFKCAYVFNGSFQETQTFLPYEKRDHYFQTEQKFIHLHSVFVKAVKRNSVIVLPDFLKVMMCFFIIFSQNMHHSVSIS